MKKKDMIKKLTKLLKSWEGSELTSKTSRQILALCESSGMLPPDLTNVNPYDDEAIYQWQEDYDKVQKELDKKFEWLQEQYNKETKLQKKVEKQSKKDFKKNSTFLYGEED